MRRMKTETLRTIEIPESSLKKIADEPVETAKLFHLIYIADLSNGITRTKSGKNFRYFFNEKLITDEDVLIRIKKLVIPPAWNDVWATHEMFAENIMCILLSWNCTKKTNSINI
jgi:DNA topoisomerase-1